MKFKFKIQGYQTDAVDNTTAIFTDSQTATRLTIVATSGACKRERSVLMVTMTDIVMPTWSFLQSSFSKIYTPCRLLQVCLFQISFEN